MEAYIPLIVSAIGGMALGPLLARLFGGSTVGGVLGGVLGGVSAHYAADAAGLGPLFASSVPAHLQSFLEGGVGGGFLGVIAGLAMKSPD